MNDPDLTKDITEINKHIAEACHMIELVYADTSMLDMLAARNCLWLARRILTRNMEGLKWNIR